MKTTLPTASKEHQETIDKIRDIIIEKIGDKLASIILFGSFARGDFVHHYYVKDGTRYSYVSDFDILIAVKKSNKYTHFKSDSFKNTITNEIKRQHLDRLHSVSLIRLLA